MVRVVVVVVGACKWACVLEVPIPNVVCIMLT